MQRREFHPPHIYEDNAVYFITASTVHHQRLLDTDDKRILVRDVLKEAIQQYGIRLYAWVILADHYHLLLKTSDVAPIYEFIKRLHGDSAIQLNKLDHKPGRKVWYQYWDRFPRSERGFWAYFNYIHLNPRTISNTMSFDTAPNPGRRAVLGAVLSASPTTPLKIGIRLSTGLDRAT